MTTLTITVTLTDCDLDRDGGAFTRDVGDATVAFVDDLIYPRLSFEK